MVERIVPAYLDATELHRRNGEYVSGDDYDRAVARIAELEAALRNIIEYPARSEMYTSDEDCAAALAAIARNAIS